ncbi:MAG TPA: glucuronate isomerase [Aggregatilineales bacterium]|nr:glucuronate isomerase [Anaerolineales bacterium]HRE47846.1 glucuronate isomerase [Aggregatilineales bacterium]
MPLRTDRYFSPDPAQKSLALALYTGIAPLPLICPHGHIDPRLFSDPDYRFGSPTNLLITPDHYILRMLYAVGVPLEQLGIPSADGTPIEGDPRAIWQCFADHWHCFRGTPTALWLRYALEDVFGISDTLTPANAASVHDQISARLSDPAFSPRQLYEQFAIEVLCTTDAATDTLADHDRIRASGWLGRILPTFRPDALLNLESAGWREEVDRLSALSGITIHTYDAFHRALAERRAFFKERGATATDHGATTPYTERLSKAQAEAIFERALRGEAGAEDAARFTGHMLIEMAGMSREDGLVMQLHVGVHRNHNAEVFRRFGRDRGADIPLAAEFTRNLKPLLDYVGNDRHLTLILFTLDEATYSRELAPLAGHYPALRLGPPWWFHDSWNGMQRYFAQVIETAGLPNTTGFNDDTRAFLSIPARHDLWRRAVCEWLSGLLVRGMIDEDEAQSMAYACAYGLAKDAYRL